MTPVTSSSETFYSYWYHPESDCLVTLIKGQEPEFGEPLDELTVEQYLAKVTKAEELPDDSSIKGILKNAKRYEHDKDVIVGDLYFNRSGQFPPGINIHTSRIQDIRSDGVYCTAYAKFYVIFAEGHK